MRGRHQCDWTLGNDQLTRLSDQRLVPGGTRQELPVRFEENRRAQAWADIDVPPSTNLDRWDI